MTPRTKIFFRQGTPARYSDPDASDAGHLICAAYHLAECGLGDLAEQATARAQALFQNIPPGKNGVKKLGQALYYPSGILEVQSEQAGPDLIQILAPAYEIDLPDARPAIKKNIASTCESALGWFAARQVLARLNQTELKAASCKPAKVLKTINSICDRFSLDMPYRAISMLSRSLHDELAKNPLSPGSNSKIQRGMRDYKNDFDFKYLTPAQLDLILSSIDLDRQKADMNAFTKNLAIVSQAANAIHWKPVPYELAYKPGQENLIRLRSEIFKALPDVFKDKDQHGPLSPWYKLRMIGTSPAASAVYEITNLITAHNALAGSGDEHLTEILTQAGMIDPDLKLSEDLKTKAASLMFLHGVMPDLGRETALTALNIVLDKLEI